MDATLLWGVALQCGGWRVVGCGVVRVGASRGDVCESGLPMRCGVLFRVFTVLLLPELAACWCIRLCVLLRFYLP